MSKKAPQEQRPTRRARGKVLLSEWSELRAKFANRQKRKSELNQKIGEMLMEQANLDLEIALLAADEAELLRKLVSDDVEMETASKRRHLRDAALPEPREEMARLAEQALKKRKLQ